MKTFYFCMINLNVFDELIDSGGVDLTVHMRTRTDRLRTLHRNNIMVETFSEKLARLPAILKKAGKRALGGGWFE